MLSENGELVQKTMYYRIRPQLAARFCSLRSNINVLCSSLQTPELPNLFSRSAGPALSETVSTVEAPLPCLARLAVFPRLQPKTKQKNREL